MQQNEQYDRYLEEHFWNHDKYQEIVSQLQLKTYFPFFFDIDLIISALIINCLKVMSNIFLLFYFLTLKESAFETKKSNFYFTSKAFFIP